MRPPAFWWRPKGLWSTLLSPVSFFYAIVADHPFGKGVTTDIPVLCIGNFVAGGAGKTPLAIALCRRLMKQGKKPVLLTRGYGGAKKGPHLVDPQVDDARSVGDEPLLLCQHAQTVVAADRVAGVEFIAKKLLSDIIVMDDGFQSARIKPTHAALVMDGERGVGNGCVLPAGPLRARLATQIMHADSLFLFQGAVAETTKAAQLIDQFKQAGKPVLNVHLSPVSQNTMSKSAIAFSGIGHPSKFFQSLKENGTNVIEEISFPDHHFFTQQEAEKLLVKAEDLTADLITTSKDAIRLKGSEGALGRLAAKVQTFEIEVVFEDEMAVDSLLSL